MGAEQLMSWRSMAGRGVLLRCFAGMLRSAAPAPHERLVSILPSLALAHPPPNPAVQVMLPPSARGNVSWIAPAGSYSIADKVIEVEFGGVKKVRGKRVDSPGAVVVGCCAWVCCGGGCCGGWVLCLGVL